MSFRVCVYILKRLLKTFNCGSDAQVSGLIKMEDFLFFLEAQTSSFRYQMGIINLFSIGMLNAEQGLEAGLRNAGLM